MSALDKLIAAHPLLFRGAPPRGPSDLPMGWYALVDELCCGIERVLGPESRADLEVTQTLCRRDGRARASLMPTDTVPACDC